jgi:hypothetical protein
MVEVYRYPYKAFTDATDYLKIDVVEYVPIGRSSTAGFSTSFTNIVSDPGSRRNQNVAPLKTILLPIPSQVRAGNAVNYDDSSLNSIAGAALGSSVDVIELGKAVVQGKLDEQLRKVKGSLGNSLKSVGGAEGLQGFASRYFASQAVNLFGANVTPNQLLARKSGEILNPNLELLFKGPTLRTFQFSFQIAPRSYDEGQQVLKIIKCFKENMAPKTQGTTNPNSFTFLKTPNVFQLTYKQGSKDHTYLHKFKQCFLNSVDVDYTNSGTYATYEDGTPVSMVINLTFKEIEPIYDIDQKSAGTVGY